MAYQSACLVVVQVHQHVLESCRVSRIILLALPCVDEARREPVAVVGVVAAAAPLPVAARRRGRHRAGLGRSHLLGGQLPATAATRRDATLTTCPADAVHDAGCQRRVYQRCFSATYIMS